MVKHIQTIRLLLPTNSLSAFDRFVGLALIKGYITTGNDEPNDNNNVKYLFQIKNKDTTLFFLI